MKNLMVLLMSLMMVNPSFADVEVEATPAPAQPMKEQKKNKPLKACVKMRKNFSAEQKAAAKEARQMFRAETEDLRMRLRKTRRRYRKIVRDTSMVLTSPF